MLSLNLIKLFHPFLKEIKDTIENWVIFLWSTNVIRNDKIVWHRFTKHINILNKSKGQSGMDNPETLTKFGTKGTRQRLTKQKHNIENLTTLATRTPPKTGSSSCLLKDTHRVTHIVKTCWTPLHTNKHK